MIIDSSKGRLAPAVQRGIDTHQGEILSEHAQFETDLTPYHTILAMTIDSPYNILVTQSFAPEFGFNNTFTLPSKPDSKVSQDNLPSAVKSHLLFDEDAIFTELNKKINTTYSLTTIQVNEKAKNLKEIIPENATPLCIKKNNGPLTFITLRSRITPDEGDQLVVLTPDKHQDKG